MVKMLKEKHDISQFIYEELQLAPWYLTGEFIDVHKKSEGSGMMQLSVSVPLCGLLACCFLFL